MNEYKGNIEILNTVCKVAGMSVEPENNGRPSYNHPLLGPGTSQATTRQVGRHEIFTLKLERKEGLSKTRTPLTDWSALSCL